MLVQAALRSVSLGLSNPSLQACISLKRRFLKLLPDHFRAIPQGCSGLAPASGLKQGSLLALLWGPQTVQGSSPRWSGASPMPSHFSSPTCFFFWGKATPSSAHGFLMALCCQE